MVWSKTDCLYAWFESKLNVNFFKLHVIYGDIMSVSGLHRKSAGCSGFDSRSNRLRLISYYRIKESR